MTVPAPVVGRSDTIAEFDRLLCRARTSGGTMALVTGEAGIGKSAVLDVVQRRAADGGWKVAGAVATGLDLALPFSTLRLALGRLSVDEFMFDRPSLLSADRRVPDESPFEAAVRIVGAALTDGPVLMAVDDLHNLDRDSLVVLAGLVRRFVGAPLLVVGSVRETMDFPAEALADVRRALMADQMLNEHRLEPLDWDSVAALAACAFDRDPTPTEVDRLLAESRGVPYFVEEALREPLQGTRSHQQRILGRILPLDSMSRSLARALSVLDWIRLEDLDLISTMIDEPVSEVYATFDRLVRAGIVLEQDGEFRFSHSLVREALYADLGPAESRLLHRRAADLLLAQRSLGAPVDVERVARHLEHSARPGDTDTARVLVTAADSTVRVAPRNAVRWYEAALSLVQKDHPDWVAWSARLVSALTSAGDERAVIGAGRHVLDIAPDGPLRHEVAVAVGSAHNFLGEHREALILLDREIGFETALVAALNQMTISLLNLQRLDEAGEISNRAVALAVDGTYDATIAGVHRALVLAGQGRTSEANRAVRTVLARSRTASTRLRGIALSVCASVLASHNAIAECATAIGELEPLLTPTDHPQVVAHREHARASVASSSGDWDGAIDILDTAIARQPVNRAITDQLRCQHAAILGARGDSAVESDIPVLEAMTGPGAATAMHVLMGIDLAAGRPDRAVRRFDATAREHGWTSEHFVEASLSIDDHDAARDMLERIAAIDDPVAGWFPAQRCRARIGGDLDAARSALTAARSAPLVHRFELARTLLLLGTLDDEPESNLAEAVELFRDLGAEPWRRAAATALRARELPVPRQKDHAPDSLSEAERAMADLVRRGMTNAEIAQQLAYSPRTVSVYLSRIYAKLGIANRVELTRLVDGGLLDD